MFRLLLFYWQINLIESSLVDCKEAGVSGCFCAGERDEFVSFSRYVYDNCVTNDRPLALVVESNGVRSLVSVLVRRSGFEVKRVSGRVEAELFMSECEGGVDLLVSAGIYEDGDSGSGGGGEKGDGPIVLSIDSLGEGLDCSDVSAMSGSHDEFDDLVNRLNLFYRRSLLSG